MGKQVKFIGLGVVVVILAILGGFKFFDRVENGNVGIRYAISGGVRDKALSQGIHFVGLDYVTQYPIKTQSIKQRVAVATSDGKKTDVKISYSYHVDPSKAVAIYKKFGSADIHWNRLASAKIAKGLTWINGKVYVARSGWNRFN